MKKKFETNEFQAIGLLPLKKRRGRENSGRITTNTRIGAGVHEKSST